MRTDSDSPKPTRSAKFSLMAAIPVVLFAGLAAYLRNADASKLRLPFGHGNDGTYVCEDASASASIRIDGSTASVNLPGEQILGLHVERTGSTLRFSGGAIYQNGYLAPDQSSLQRGGSVTLGTIGDDGQTISITLPDGGSMRFVRQ